MTLYLDTSDLVKLYVDEPHADEIRSLVAETSAVATSVIAYPEARSTFARRRRERLMTVSEVKAAVRHLDADWPRFVLIRVDNELGRMAGQLAESHGVRGCDAVHLASFVRLLGATDDEDVRFLSADARLVRAARSLG
ncbi:MAG TPA: type II toxin-antitoxin system VapC family toxin [Vicinamibacterales bacterium]|nr:type II toxin-antitoxin system VapC family toxin [Vicinamibacterales bacterium]